MKLVEELPVGLRLDEIRRFLGYPEDREPPDRISALISSLVQLSAELIRARGIWTAIPRARAAELGLPLPDPGRSGDLAIGLVTIGGELEARAAELAQQPGGTTGALILEAVGSAAAEEAADLLCAEILGHLGQNSDPGVPAPGVQHRSPAVGCRVSPGYGGWPIEAQAAVFDLLPAERIGLRLTESMLMVPRKSISFALGLSRDGPPLRSGCEACGLARCPFRRVGG